MKFIFMLLALFLLTGPALAAPANNTSQCLKMYGTYMHEYGASLHIPDAKLLNFIDTCLPAATTGYDEPMHQKLLQIIYGNEKIVTVKT